MALIDDLLSLPGHEILLEIPEDFLQDDFNLAGLSDRSDIGDVDEALAILSNIYDSDSDDSEREDGDERPNSANTDSSNNSNNSRISPSAQRLYYVMHQRYAMTKSGLSEVLQLCAAGRFGRCRRYHCKGAVLLPYGESVVCGRSPLRGYCPACRDLYVLSGRKIDGACYGPNVTGMLLLTSTQIKNIPSTKNCLYEPRIFGFRLAKYAHK